MMKFNAQFFDSIHVAMAGKRSIDARLESRFSFIDNNLSSVNGCRLGFAYQQKLRFGMGVNWLNSELKRDFIFKNSFNVQDTTTQYFKWISICLYTDIVFYKTKRWQLSVPLQVGLGNCWWQNDSKYHFSNYNVPKYFVFTYEPGITIQYKIFKWLGLGSDVAYRFCIKDNSKINVQLSNPTYSFKILFWADQLFYELFKEHKITKRFGPAYW